MPKLLLIVLFATALTAPAHARKGSHRVKSYTTKSGKYVQSHRKTNPNKTKSDNWSTKGNVNPHTGRRGTK